MNMQRIKYRIAIYAWLLPGLAACKHPFDVPGIPANARPLVVEGVINGTPQSPTTVILSRVQDLAHADSLTPELHAQVLIEGEDGYSYPFYETGQGGYEAFNPNLVLYKNYRIHITASDGNQYISDFVPMKRTPAIDSLEWNQNSDVTIYVNTHDPLDSTIYYRWDYVETWNYLSNLSTPWGIVNRKIFLKDSLTQTDSCWRTAGSNNIVTTNTLALGQDLVSHFPIATVALNSEKISHRYSILVRQYALTKEAYEFYLTLQKNTQQTGSLFDPQPSQLATNIHCTTNPGEAVIGFISASTIEEKRMFIRNTQLQNWNYQGVAADCDHVIFTYQDPVDFTIYDYPDTTYAPYYFVTGGGMTVVKASCTDCRYYGGTNVKPPFW